MSLVTHHLLLRDVATRRNIDDPATVERVARAVGTIEVLQLLAALTEADGIATGAAAWDPWKAELVGRLVDHVAHRLDGSAPTSVESAPFPSDELLQRLAAGGRHLEARNGVLTVMTADRPGIFSRVAGVLASTVSTCLPPARIRRRTGERSQSSAWSTRSETRRRGIGSWPTSSSRSGRRARRPGIISDAANEAYAAAEWKEWRRRGTGSAPPTAA